MYSKFRFGATISTCKDCKDRKVGCHGYCERYKEERAKYDNQSANIRKIKQDNGDVSKFLISNAIKRTRGQVWER